MYCNTYVLDIPSYVLLNANVVIITIGLGHF